MKPTFRDPDELLERYHNLLVNTTISLELTLNPQNRSPKQKQFSQITLEEATRFLKEQEK
jgi:hypothetical protein